MNSQRRVFLSAALTGGAAALAAAAGVLTPGRVLAAWPAGAFEAADVDGALQALLGDASPAASGEVVVKAPDIAENGAVVSITVETNLPDVESISILARDNTSPLTGSFLMGDTADGFVTTRIKMRKTSDVIAVVKSKGKLYSASKPVKVTLGGCGG